MKTLSIYFVDANTGLLRCGLRDKKARKITDENLLVEKVIKLLFTKLNSSFFSPEIGSEFSSLVGKSRSLEFENIVTTVQLSVTDVETYIKDEQKELNLPNNQILRELKLLGIEQNPHDATSFFIQLAVITEATKQFNFTLTL